MDQAKQWITLPNVITTIRILGSPGLIVLSAARRPYLLAGLTAFLVATEWLDGFLARRLRRTSALGARLDTIADGAFYACLMGAVIFLRPRLIARETAWIVAAISSYAISWLASWIKFRCLPSYHTWAAKGVWGVVVPGIILLLADGGPWLFRTAMVCVLVTNLEAVAITYALPTCKVDVPTFWHAWREGRQPG